MVVEQDAKTTKLSAQLAQLESSLGTLGQSVNKLRAAQTRTTLDGTTGLPLHDAQWLQQQSPKAYTVQLLTADTPAELTQLITRHAATLADAGLAYTRTERNGQDRYNLFYGVFAHAAAHAQVTKRTG